MVKLLAYELNYQFDSRKENPCLSYLAFFNLLLGCCSDSGCWVDLGFVALTRLPQTQPVTSSVCHRLDHVGILEYTCFQSDQPPSGLESDVCQHWGIQRHFPPVHMVVSPQVWGISHLWPSSSECHETHSHLCRPCVSSRWVLIEANWQTGGLLIVVMLLRFYPFKANITKPTNTHRWWFYRVICLNTRHVNVNIFKIMLLIPIFPLDYKIKEPAYILFQTRNVLTNTSRITLKLIRSRQQCGGCTFPGQGGDKLLGSSKLHVSINAETDILLEKNVNDWPANNGPRIEKVLSQHVTTSVLD